MQQIKLKIIYWLLNLDIKKQLQKQLFFILKSDYLQFSL